MIIYKTTNLVNGKIYIGKDSKNDPTYLGSGIILKAAISKYGVDSFKKEVIEECDSKDKLDEREIFWIKEYNTTDRNVGYNVARGGTGGDTTSNHPNKDKIIEARNKKVSESLIGHYVSDEARKNQSISHTGWFDRMAKEEQEEYRIKQSIALKEYYSNNKHHSKGKNLSKEHKDKLSKHAKENSFGGDTWSNLTESERQTRSEKLSASKRGKKLSEETKLKIKESLKGRIMNEETKNKISTTLKNKKQE
jgi:hypothetical protein